MASISTMIWRSVMLVLIAVAILIAANSRTNNTGVDTEAMLDVSVSIKTISHVHTDSIGDSVWAPGSGSGFLVNAGNCEVWTNQHVIADAAIIEVFPRGWKTARGIPAQVLNSSPHADIAILKMDACDGVPQARIGNSGAVRAGDETFAVGNPLGKNPDSISRGIISNTQRYVRDATAYLQTDAAINPGNSGGALFNHNGEVIGINTAIATIGGVGANMGIGYAIPINYAARISESLHDGHPSWGDAGINTYLSSLTPDEAEIFHVPPGHSAVILTESPSNGAAVDKLFAHDVIYRIGDQAVEDAAQARRIIHRLTAGQNVKFAIMRKAEPVTVEITLDDGWKATEIHQAEYYNGYLGLSLEMWADNGGERARVKTPVITKVQSLGPAHRAHIASSQRAMFMNGAMWMAFMLDVKTVTGVVINGLYHPVGDVESINEHVHQAYALGQALLLEIQVWRRENPTNLNQPLRPVGKAFYKVTPAITTAMKPVDDEVAQVSSSDNNAVDTVRYRGVGYQGQ